jgi:phosphotransferase system enzyme I (PtsI)
VGPAVVVGGRPSPPADETVPADLDEVMGLLEGTLAALADSFRTRAESMDGEIAEIFEATAMMAEDPTLRVRSRELIESGLGPATAIDRVTQQMADALSAAGGYLAERVTDLMSIRDRVIARLLNLPEPGIPILSAPSVILACDLAPADTALIDLNLVLGIATEQGGPTGHVAIIAGQYGIPCVIGAPGVTGIPPGSPTVVDAARGIVIADPSPEDVAAVTRRREAELRRAEDSGAGETADGHKVEVLANIGAERDVDRALATVHDGIGLFRTEFLYLDRRTAPGVDEQADRYRKVLRAYAGRKVVVRTLDAGADKPLAFASLGSGIESGARRAGLSHVAGSPGVAVGPTDGPRPGCRGLRYRMLGDGADGVDPAGGGGVRGHGARSWAGEGRRHDRSSECGATGVPDSGARRFPVVGYE